MSLNLLFQFEAEGRALEIWENKFVSTLSVWLISRSNTLFFWLDDSFVIFLTDWIVARVNQRLYFLFDNRSVIWIWQSNSFSDWLIFSRVDWCLLFIDFWSYIFFWPDNPFHILHKLTNVSVFYWTRWYFSDLTTSILFLTNQLLPR